MLVASLWQTSQLQKDVSFIAEENLCFYNNFQNFEAKICLIEIRQVSKDLIMEQRALKNVNNNMNMNIYSYLETSDGQSSNTYLNVVLFFNTSVY